jgi:hypothetical protein
LLRCRTHACILTLPNPPLLPRPHTQTVRVMPRRASGTCPLASTTATRWCCGTRQQTLRSPRTSPRWTGTTTDRCWPVAAMTAWRVCGPGKVGAQRTLAVVAACAWFRVCTDHLREASPWNLYSCISLTYLALASTCRSIALCTCPRAASSRGCCPQRRTHTAS